MDKVTRQCPQTTTFWRERRAEAVSNRGPSAYQPNALPLGINWSLFSALEQNHCTLVACDSEWWWWCGWGLMFSDDRLTCWRQRFWMMLVWVGLNVLQWQADLLGTKILSKWLQPFIAHLEYPPKWCTYNAVWLLHGWCHVKLLPSRRTFCVHHTTVHQFTLSYHWNHIRRVRVCLAVTCCLGAHSVCTIQLCTSLRSYHWNHIRRVRVCLAVTCCLGAHSVYTIQECTSLRCLIIETIHIGCVCV